MFQATDVLHSFPASRAGDDSMRQIKNSLMMMNNCSGSSTLFNNSMRASDKTMNNEVASSNTSHNTSSEGDNDASFSNVISTSVIHSSAANGNITLSAQNPAFVSSPETPSSVVFSSDDQSHERMTKKKILIIFTGGTIGMSKDAEGVLKPSKGFLERTMANFPEINHEDIPNYDILEWDTPIDSSDFTPDNWVVLANQVAEHYYLYDGFVILHGTDTMAYTASALSFMLENLGKAVILTGSMIPLEEPVSDAKRNLLISMMVAAHLNVTEVLLFFNTHLLRGNRAKKTDPWKLAAIESPNLEPLATMGVGIHVRSRHLLRPPSRQFKCYTSLFRSIIVLSMAPGFCYDSLITIASEWRKTSGREPPAIVLLLYGSGNAPINNPRFTDALKVCLEQKCPVVVMSQCIRGSVDLTQYEAGTRLSKMGIIDGKDMTMEACVAKLAYLMGRGLRGSRLKNAMETDLRGELTSKNSVSYTGMGGNQGFVAKL